MKLKIQKFVKKVVDDKVFVSAQIKGKIPNKKLKELRSRLNEVVEEFMNPKEESPES